MSQISQIIQLGTTEELIVLAKAFAGPPYNKPLTIFEEYFDEQRQGVREIHISILNGSVIGYATLVWSSPYPPFREENIPEIKDLNILIEHRRQGYATSLIRSLEQRVRGEGYSKVGIGVGVTSDYDAARKLYPSMGYVSDGRGIHPDEWGGATYFIKCFD